MLSLIVRVNTAPATEVRLGVGSASVPVTAELKAPPISSYATLAVPLSCFSTQDLMKTSTIAHLEADFLLDCPQISRVSPQAKQLERPRNIPLAVCQS